MEYNKKFEELLRILPDDEYVGLGNPNAKILFIGKEAGCDTRTENYHGIAKQWKENQIDYSKRYIPEDQKIRNLNHTWQRYQKLYESILFKLDIKDEAPKKYEITFVENIFTTEFSNLPALNTKIAKQHPDFKVKLMNRKQSFFKSEFIDQFQVIIIFANDNKYIETYPGEVCELFKVKFDHLYDCPGKNKIWVHSSIKPEDNPKLLIHTRQLAYSSNELTNSISEIIANFLNENSLDIESQ